MPPNVLSADLKVTAIIENVQNVSKRNSFLPREDTISNDKQNEPTQKQAVISEKTELTPKRGAIDETAQSTPKRGSYEIVWSNVIVCLYYHLAALYGLYLCFTAAMWQTIVFSCLTYVLSGLGVTAGVHRLWSHKTYKARMPLQIFLMICHSLANQRTAIHWVRNHRLHHKFSDTDADPHNSTRGFFFSHIGWIMVKKHPEARKKMKTLDLSDVYANPVLQFQQKHANWLIVTTAFVLPTLIPYLWNEDLSISYHINMLRFIMTLHATFLVNSVAHMWGYRPYDSSIKPAENIAVAVLTLGEGFHNYHHVFPYDYRTAELGGSFWNLTTFFVDFCATIGQAYDRRCTGENELKDRIKRTGVDLM